MGLKVVLKKGVITNFLGQGIVSVLISVRTLLSGPPSSDKKNCCSKCRILYSRVCDDPVSSLAFQKGKDSFLAIGLTPKMKSVCLRILEDSFDVRQLTLFPDIEGFCYANSENFGRYSNERC